MNFEELALVSTFWHIQKLTSSLTWNLHGRKRNVLQKLLSYCLILHNNGSVHVCHPSSSSMDDIHGWKSLPWMTSKDDTIIQGWDFSIHVYFIPKESKFHPKTWRIIHRWKCHIWMSSMDGETSSLDESVIRGCHPWMTSTDEDDGWRTWIEQ